MNEEAKAKKAPFSALTAFRFGSTGIKQAAEGLRYWREF